MIVEREKLYHKIKHLLAKAESTPFQEEAALFLSKAQELMVRYTVSEEDIWRLEGKRPEPVVHTVIVSRSAGSQWKRVLLNSCARHNRCRSWYTPDRKEVVCSIAGYESDVVYVEMLFTSLQIQMSFQLAFGLASTSENASTFRVNFIEAFALRIDERLAALEDGLEVGTALVLRSRGDEVDRFVERTAGPLHINRVNTSGRHSAGAKALGALAADTADIVPGRGKVNEGKRGLPSGS